MSTRGTSLAAPSTVTLAILLVIASAAYAADTGTKAERIDALMSRYHELGQFNGAVLVAQNGKVLLQKGYGSANMEWDIPNTPETRFRIGSITKQFTAMLTLQLVAEDKLSLEATLADLLPYYRKDTGSRVTLHQLLNHTSGIPSYTSSPDFVEETSRDPHGVEEFATRYCSGDLEFEPGSEFLYDNSGYFLLGAILEQVTEKSYDQLLHERILEPLGMRSTGYDRATSIIRKRAGAYERTATGFRNADYLDMSIPYAAGSMYSTVGDLYLWDRALHGLTLLGEELSARMLAPGMGNYAYGWIVHQRPLGSDGTGRTVATHGGGIHGFNALIERVVDDQHLVVLLNNTGRTELQEMSGGILDVLYDRTSPEPQPPASR